MAGWLLALTDMLASAAGNRGGHGVAAKALGPPDSAYTVASETRAKSGAEASPAGDYQALVDDAPATSDVSSRALGKGFAFYPSTPRPRAFGFAIGGLFDAIDPQVMYGYHLRLPQLALDARYGLGKGVSLRGHFNSMVVVSELLAGVSYARQVEHWAAEVSMSVGVYAGMLNYFGFDALLLSPQYRPEVAVGYDLGKAAVSLRGTLLLMGPERVRVGEVWGGLDNSDAFVGHSEMLYVENTNASGSAWYFGGGVMTTRAYYALWLLFPDSPGLFTYPRIVAGYEY